MLKQLLDYYGWKKVIGVTLAIIVVLLVVVFLVTKFAGCNSNGENSSKTIIIHDTLVVDRYNENVRVDTVVRWYEKPVYKQVQPDVIYTQKVDTVFKLHVDSLEVMLRLEKKGDEIIVTAYDKLGSKLDEIHYKGIGRDFIATSQPHGVFIKAKKFYSSGFRLFGNYQLPVNSALRWDSWSAGTYEFGAKDGLSYLDKINGNIFGKYRSETKDAVIGLEMEWFPFR